MNDSESSRFFFDSSKIREPHHQITVNPPPVRSTEVPNEDKSSENNDPRTPNRSPATMTNKPKFHLASKLNQMVTTEDVGRKIMEATYSIEDVRTFGGIC